MLDLCIIGGGASAMAAAVAAAGERPQISVCMLEKKESLGKKLAATGNGKCNLSNTACPNASGVLDFFSSIGILTRSDEQGRIYPYSQQARDVVRGLELQIKERGIQVKTSAPVQGIEKVGGVFSIGFHGGSLKARSVLLATGGKAAPQFGSSGDGYALAKKLGHTITRLAPSLTGIEVTEDFAGLKGIRVKGCVSLKEDGQPVSRETGEIQFTEDSISGICVFNLSRLLRLREGESFAEGMGRFGLSLDFLPELEPGEVAELLNKRRGILGMKAEELLLSIVPKPLALRLLEEAGIEAGLEAAELDGERLERLGKCLKGWQLPVKGTRGWKAAQCTAGGIALEEIHLPTMESKIVSGLYFSGEIIDFDGPCGGFNLQNAWETGIRAGKAAAHV